MSHSKWRKELEKSKSHCLLIQNVNGIQRFDGKPTLKQIRQYFNSKDFEMIYEKSKKKSTKYFHRLLIQMWVNIE